MRDIQRPEEPPTNAEDLRIWLIASLRPGERLRSLESRGNDVDQPGSESLETAAPAQVQGATTSSPFPRMVTGSILRMTDSRLVNDRSEQVGECRRA